MREIDRQVMYSVVIPVYNSSVSLMELTSRLERVFEEKVEESFELIYVDDGSTNTETWQTLEKLVLIYPFLSVIRLTKNFGKPSAVMCGISHALGRWVITMDDDLQHLPEDIPKLLEFKSHDVVIGQFDSRSHNRSQLTSSWIKSKFEKAILGSPIRFTPFKLIDADIAKAMLSIYSPTPFISSLITQITTDIVMVPVEHHVSAVGSSRYRLTDRFKQFSNLLIGNSSLLLRSLGVVGIFTALIGFGFAINVAIQALTGSIGVSGWASLMTVVLIYGGLLLIAFSIVGEYLIRILEGVGNRPTYVTRTVIKGSTASTSDSPPD